MANRGRHLPRRLFHMAAASIFPLLALALDRGLFFAVLVTVTLVWVLADSLRLLIPPLNRLFHRLLRALLRPAEAGRITGASFVLLGTLATFLAFPKDVAVVAVLFVAAGDPVAALVGSRFARGRLFGKSPWGSAAMTVAALVVFGVLRLAGAVEVGWPAALVGAVVAAIVELLPLPLNDNLRVPLAAGAAMALMG